tara:strand:+ start:382 stop:1278 length:897 start_codon:yes stop_codon:yes gene_type:complete
MEHPYELRLHRLLERLSNNENEDLLQDKERVHQIIDDAGEMWKEAMAKQLLREKEPSFRIRGSNAGRPLCQLQMEKMGKPKSRMPYNHLIRMMHGDAIECIIEILLRVEDFNITGGKDKVSLTVNDTEIRGESDIDIDDAVWDTKSASPWAFSHKWSDGFEGLAKKDDFGYVSQLTLYSMAQNKKTGGWIVVDKSSGHVKFVECPEDPKSKADVLRDVKHRVENIDSEFKRCFEPEEETFRKKPTGSKRLSDTCSFCNYLGSCWPKAQHLPQTMSQAKNPRHYWYTEYEGEVIDGDKT